MEHKIGENQTETSSENKLHLRLNESVPHFLALTRMRYLSRMTTVACDLAFNGAFIPQGPGFGMEELRGVSAGLLGSLGPLQL